ncbi:unnamed protein product (macronuclear) [Paramecium tetraurelia]|uniref:Uncharacterized protein n=1 Tax=Paramecium tetraurelia TaxID=5888 RepID=A0E6R0_PARTE|nr:uncharacterized protein GSPATT00023705001 [Paramecium tetraurelia]CAK90977.1 unnamed protein product [Paramecium tetraurelia]|eukprot:XP_001458374.1 hypothetical protein (macronuclear) [Paramecium tetraurelia strain d4-2]
MSRSSIPRQLPPLQQKRGGEGEMPFGGQQQLSQPAEKKVDFANSNFEQNEDQQENEDERLQPAPNHDSGMTYTNFMNDDIIYNCYSLGDRIGARLSRLIHCDPPRLTFVDRLNKLEYDQIVNPFSLSEKDKAQITPDRTVVVRIIGTSQLQMDTNIQHPFIRMHVINIKNGCYLYKPKNEDNQAREFTNAVYNYESNCITNIVDGERERVTCELELLTAFSTNFCDMRMATNSRADWNEEILINIPADEFYKSDTIILFELLDFHPIYLQQHNSEFLDSDNFYRIAWGYTRPNGLCRLHLGLSKIQLYKYLFDTSKLKSVSRRESIPLVYFDFLWLDKVEYDAVLNVYLGTEAKPQFLEIYGKNRSTNVFEIEKGDEEAREKVKHSVVIDKVIEQRVEEITDQEKINLRRRRYLGDKEDHIPDKIAYKFASAPMGCYRLAFNKYGNYLACACTYKNSKTIIKLFDVETGQHFTTYKGHRNIIHDLQFSQNSQYLITVSSDYTAKVWSVPQHSGDIVSEEDSDLMLICQLQHPSFVYAGLFLMDSKLPVVATCCFDSRMRIWQFESNQSLQISDEPIQQEIISYDGISFDQFDNLGNHRHPNCIVYDGVKCLYVGDSLGNVHFFDINLSGVIQEISGNAINQIQLMPPEQQDLLIHTRDNCLRIVDFKSGDVNNRFFGSQSVKIACRSVPSPKGDYVLSGSEDGKPHLWSNLTQTLPTDLFQFNVIGPVADVAWNIGYHMIAVAGFGDEHPILIYVWEREGDLNFIEAKKLQDEIKIKHREQDDIVFNIQAKQTLGRFQQSIQAQGLFQPQLAQSSQIPFLPQSVFNQQQPGNQSKTNTQAGPFGSSGPFGQPQQGPFGQSQQQQQPFGQPQQQSQGPFGQSQVPFGQQQNPLNSGPFGQPQSQGPFSQMPFQQQQQVPPNNPNTPYNANYQMPFS